MLSALCPSKVHNDNPHSLAWRNVRNGKSLSLGLQERIPLPIKANQNAQLGINHMHCFAFSIYVTVDIYTPAHHGHRCTVGSTGSLSLSSTLFASQYKDTNDNSFSVQVMSDVHRLFLDCGFLRPNIFYFTIHVRVQRLVSIFSELWTMHIDYIWLISIGCILRWY